MVMMDLSNISSNGSNGNRSRTEDEQRNIYSKIAHALQTIKSELEQDEKLTQPELQEKFSLIENLVQAIQGQPNLILAGAKKQLFQSQRDRLTKVTEAIRQASDLQSFFNNAVRVLREILDADRVLIYQFEDRSQGQVIAESQTSGWTPMIDEMLPSISFGAAKISQYNSQSVIVIDQSNFNQLTPYQQQLLTKFQIKTSLTVPIKINVASSDNSYTLNQVWGLLVVQQCRTMRQWREEDIYLLTQIARELTLAIQPTQLRLQQGQEDLLMNIDLQIQQSMQKMLHQIRQSLQADRVLIYGFNPDWSGEVLAESVDSQWVKAGDSFDKDYFLTTENHKPYYVVNNIAAQNVAPCLRESVEALQAKAYIAVSIKHDDHLLGILTVYQNSEPRNWQPSEIEQMQKYAARFSQPLKQISSIRHLKFQAKKFEQFSQQDFLTSINNEAQAQMQNLLEKIRASMRLDRAVVFAFNPDWSGKVLAESFGSNWNPTGSVLDKDFHFKGGEYEPYYIANDIKSKGLARAVLEQFEKMQARAYIVVPIVSNSQLLGVLGVYQNSGPRNWQESDVKQVQEFATRFVLPLQQTSYLRNIEFQNQQTVQAVKTEKSLSKILEKVRLSKEEQAVYQITTNEGRKILDVDRVAIYRFNPDWSGNFIAESAAPGWSKVTEIIPFIEDTFLQNTKGGRYKNGECFSVEDIYLAGHKECHIELLEQMEARAYVLAPIFIADSNMFGSKKLWGLIGVYQNTGARRWQSSEIDVVRQLGLQVGIALQQINYIKQLESNTKQDLTVNKIIELIRQSLDLNDIFTTATKEIRKLIEADRVVVYRFNPDWSGEVIAESVASGWVSVMELQKQDKTLYSSEMSKDSDGECTLTNLQSGAVLDKDTYLRSSKGGEFTRGKKFQVVNDVYKAGFSECYLESLEKYQAKAYVIVPIFQNNKLCGLLAAYQNSTPRNWEISDVDLMLKIAPQLSFALQQASYTRQIQAQAEKLTRTVERERGLARLLEGMQQAKEAQTIYQTACKETRKLLAADRVTISQINSDKHFEFVGESAAGKWSSLMNKMSKINDSQFNAKLIQDLKQGALTVENIYDTEFEAYYVEQIEKFEAKAYIIVPIYRNEQLWGMVSAFQNSGPRFWEAEDISALKQVAVQISVALKQLDYLEQVQVQSENLSQTLQREKAAKEQLQQQAMEMLVSVKPAFRGDLTVRATVTDNEIGTIAGAFNTTLDSLKEIVTQVQTAVEQVAQTTGSSNTAIEGLSKQAQQQFVELNQALNKIQAMVNASEMTTQNAQKVEQALQQANQTVQVGDQAMNNTVESILSIRQTVAEAGKRVKKLSDSSQKISKVVNLISSFAAQTNLLALNAALEATRAGEYGKGFAVVADEVRNLSLQSADATTEIENLVQEIQAETQAVASAMNTGIEQVSEGTNLVNQTRDSLNQIVTATAEISELVKDITSAAYEQTQEAETVTEVMSQVAAIANDTSQDTNAISASFQELLSLAQNLQSSVAQFKIK